MYFFFNINSLHVDVHKEQFLECNKVKKKTRNDKRPVKNAQLVLYVLIMLLCNTIGLLLGKHLVHF